MKDKSILEIDTSDIQGHYNGDNISYDDLVKFTENKVSGNRQSKQSQNDQQIVVNNQGFYVVSQIDYIEYQIAKREAIKRSLRRKKISTSLWLGFIWLLKTLINIILIIGIFWIFYMMCWSIQKTF